MVLERIDCFLFPSMKSTGIKKLPCLLPNQILLISGDALKYVGTWFQFLVQAGISPVFKQEGGEEKLLKLSCQLEASLH